ncbi:MAG: hypothetical protein PUB87_05160 [Eubacteriaceae bacterium]|nr:hypothetical protein [Eubacteriaceae bacterium]
MVFIEYLAVGITGSLALIVAAKVVMAKLLQRKPGYYEASGAECDGGGEHHE